MGNLILSKVGEVQTMTSLEIESLTGSRHDSVKRTIERLAYSGVIVQPPSVDEQLLPLVTQGLHQVN